MKSSEFNTHEHDPVVTQRDSPKQRDKVHSEEVDSNEWMKVKTKKARMLEKLQERILHLTAKSDDETGQEKRTINGVVLEPGVTYIGKAMKSFYERRKSRKSKCKVDIKLNRGVECQKVKDNSVQLYTETLLDEYAKCVQSPQSMYHETHLYKQNSMKEKQSWADVVGHVQNETTQTKSFVGSVTYSPVFFKQSKGKEQSTFRVCGGAKHSQKTEEGNKKVSVLKGNKTSCGKSVDSEVLNMEVSNNKGKGCDKKTESMGEVKVDKGNRTTVIEEKLCGSDKDREIQSKAAENGQDINTFEVGNQVTYKTSSKHDDECANDQSVKSQKSTPKNFFGMEHDSKFHKQSVNTSNVNLEEKQIPNENISNMEQNTLVKCVALGNFHQGNARFGFYSGKQCVSNSFAAILYSKITDVSQWQKQDLDKVLNYGNELYKFIQLSSAINDNFLLISELPDQLEAFDVHYKMQYSQSVMGTICGDEFFLINFNAVTLKDALHQELDRHDACFCTFGGQTFAILSTRKQYFIFDSHSRDRHGLMTDDGTSVVLCTSNWKVVYRPPTYRIKDFCESLNNLLEELHKAASGASSATASWDVPTAMDASEPITAVSNYSPVVIDRENPILTGCPTDIVANTSPGTSTMMVSWLAPVASDNSDSATLTVNLPLGSSFVIGSTEVTYTATNPTGNFVTCSFDIIVLSTDAPVLSNFPPDQTVFTSQNAQGAVATWSALTATDNSDDVMSITSDFSSETLFPFGVTTVTFTATDSSGNIDTFGANPCSSNPCAPSEQCFYIPAQYLCIKNGRRRREAEMLDLSDICPCQNGDICFLDDATSSATCECWCAL
ncbi:uncharacterized protein LOC115924739 [Strongylocentrotus purpuratus]|uniref:HYR domain-containing protein n=1 Tax=Strongylocentrotus purpuratus TaxID=7668 RepID=A0A7M7NYQ0_STRPU|nr:uncharacterized protein LOC115924739 [Strongylocentrotus purpuratus]